VIIPRSGSYGVSVYDPALKRKRWVGTYETMREAKAAARDAAARRSVSGRTTCGEYVELWLTEYSRLRQQLGAAIATRCSASRTSSLAPAWATSNG
jgi:hypothetical protein